MKLKTHFFIGLIISFILIRFFDFSLLSGLIVFLSSWLIDVDHYFWYRLEIRDWNPIEAVKWRIKFVPKWRRLSLVEKSKFKREVLIFHGVGFWSILVILSFFYKFFYWVLIGIAIHMIADWVDLIREGEPLYNKTFPLYVIKRNKNKKSLKEL